jgi:hypothetical protein
VKFRVQLTPELTAALVCASIWSVFWLTAFRPVAFHPEPRSVLPSVTRLAAGGEDIRKLRIPELFALPNERGFSSGFFAERIDLRPALEKPLNPAEFLPRETAAAPILNPDALLSGTALNPGRLPAPAAVLSAALRPPKGTQIFLPPELQQRAAKDLPFHRPAGPLPETVRVYLNIRSDGAVGSVLFDTPVTNAVLFSAIRQLRFIPADKETGGWMEIRFAPEEKP